MDLKLKNKYYQLCIGKDDDIEPVWVKKLKLILQTDIHQKPLGCKISNTHMKIGDVHMDSFYEAQILFSHARWIGRFSGWLNKVIREDLESDTQNLIIIGYETYTEPVLFALKNKLTSNSKLNVFYGIYEEPKFIQNRTDAKTNVRIRYVENIKKQLIYGNTQIIFLCGISSTLSTFNKISTFFNENVILNDKGAIINNKLCYSLIQVLPNNEKNEFGISNKINAHNQRKIAYSNKYEIEARYLVSVDCKWYDADTCEFCFPENPLSEKPIIQTSETSVVPVQMIAPHCNDTKCNSNTDEINEKIDFFEKKGGHYKYKDYLYYNHIDRMDHHYKYYIRTGHLLKKILADKNDNDIFMAYCNKIKKELDVLERSSINVIISPSHFSDEVFPNAINEYVFEGKAHMISFDPQKEFRSNFETKYSNFAYFISQTRMANETVNIRFFYVDDQLSSGNNFYRVQSLVRSLMSERYKVPENVKIFDAVIIFLSRISNSTKMDYVDKIGRYYSFIDISIPSIRNYGDSCPICKLRQNAATYAQASTLNICAKHWSEKYWYHSTKSLEEAKQQHETRLESEKKLLIERHFRRLECENILWKKTSRCLFEEHYINKIISAISDKERRGKGVDCEYLISFIKGIAAPFLYYKENEKKAALKILLECIVQILNITQLSDSCQLHIEDYSFTVDFRNNYEKYSLIVVLVNCLAEMDSAYILNVGRIATLCNIIKNIDNRLISYDLVELEGVKVGGIFSIIANACKRIVCGISGKSKIKHFDLELKNSLFNPLYEEEFQTFCKILYLENTNYGISESEFQLKYDSIKKNKEIVEITSEGTLVTLQKYDCLSAMLKEFFDIKQASICFFYYDSTLQSKWFQLQKDGYEKSDEIDEKCLGLLKNIPSEGVLFDDNICVLELNHFDIDDMGRTTKASFQTENHINSKKVYLYFKFEKKVGLDELSRIRSALQYRYILCKEIAKDLSTDAIKVAIQAKAAEDLLKTDKAISHGAMEELNLLFTQATSLIDGLYGEKSRFDSNKIKNVCNSVNIFMNRCIGYCNTHQIMQKYFSAQKKDSKSNIIKNKQETPFCNSVQHIANLEWENGWKFFCDYLREIENEKSEYLSSLVKKENKNFHVKVHFSQTRVHFVDCVKTANNIPFFLNSGGADAKYAIVFLIGIIDVLIRNAIKHGIPVEETLDIKCEFSQSGAIGEYKILVSNHKKSIKSNPGITKKFFDFINNSVFSFENESVNYFMVNVDSNECQSLDIHTATVKIVCPFRGSEDGIFI